MTGTSSARRADQHEVMAVDQPKAGDYLAFYPDPNSRRTIKTQITEIEPLRPGRTHRDMVLTVLEKDPARAYQVGEQIRRMEGDFQITPWRDREAVALPRYLIQGRYITLEVSGPIRHLNACTRTIRWKLVRRQAEQIVKVLNAAVQAGFDHMTVHDQLVYEATHGRVTSRRAREEPDVVEPVVLLEGLRPLYLADQIAVECQTAFELGACA